MRIVVALGGNALLRRGELMSAANQLRNVKKAAEQIAKIANNNQLVITHGNGPQVGLLALQSNADQKTEPYPLDVLGAETEGMIGYLLEQEIANRLPSSRAILACLTRVEVDEKDPAFANPSKPIGPFYSAAEAQQIAQSKHWFMAVDGDKFRRAVPSPKPKKILEIEPILWMLERNAVVIAAGGGGIPVLAQSNGVHAGVEAVIDKDLCSSLLAREIKADLLIICTDVDGVYLDWGKATQKLLTRTNPNDLKKIKFAAGSMAPKVQAACEFVEASGKSALIGSIDHIEAILAGTSGTRIEV
jgi:carbamate kinase